MNLLHILATQTITWPGQSGEWSDAQWQAHRQEHLLLPLLAISAILIIWLIARQHTRMGNPPTPRRPWGLFWGLQRHLGISPVDRILLIAIACSRELKQPSILLLSPALFATHTKAWLRESRVAAFLPAAAQRLERIGRLAFPQDS